MSPVIFLPFHSPSLVLMFPESQAAASFESTMTKCIATWTSKATLILYIVHNFGGELRKRITVLVRKVNFLQALPPLSRRAWGSSQVWVHPASKEPCTKRLHLVQCSRPACPCAVAHKYTRHLLSSLPRHLKPSPPGRDSGTADHGSVSNALSVQA